MAGATDGCIVFYPDRPPFYSPSGHPERRSAIRQRYLPTTSRRNRLYYQDPGPPYPADADELSWRFKILDLRSDIPTLEALRFLPSSTRDPDRRRDSLPVLEPAAADRRLQGGGGGMRLAG